MPLFIIGARRIPMPGADLLLADSAFALTTHYSKFVKKQIMHNNLKYFRDGDLNTLIKDMETFMKAENVSGKSISLAKDGHGITALLGYLPGNANNHVFSFKVKHIGHADESSAHIQHAINAAADQVGSFICQAGIIDNNNLSVVFLVA